jgi:hypothetical protein
MGVSELGEREIERIKEHVSKHRMTLAIIRTEHAPSGLEPLLQSLAQACGLKVLRNISSPTSDFGFAELNSNDIMLVVLYIGGKRTELVSISETDEVLVADLEDTVCSSNIQSSSIRDGL